MSVEEEYWASTDVGRYIGISRQRVDQLVEAGRLPAPVGRLGRQRIWRAAEVIAHQQTLSGPDGKPQRLAVPDWDALPAPDGGALALVTDTVMPVYSRGAVYGQELQVHVRIWRGTADGERRLVVLYGCIAESYMSVINYAETIVSTITANYLGPEALTAWWFDLWPAGLKGLGTEDAPSIDFVSFARNAEQQRGSGLAAIFRRGSEVWDGEFNSPSWHPVTRERFAAVLGSEPDLDYPPGTYTAYTATALAHGVRPVTVDHDPRQLGSKLADLTVLHRYRLALEGEPDVGDVPALELLLTTAAESAEGTASQAAALASAALVLSGPVLAVIATYAHDSVIPHPGDTLVVRNWRTPTEAEQAVVEVYGAVRDAEGGMRAGLTTRSLREGLAHLRSWSRALGSADYAKDAQADPLLADAIGRAVPELTGVLYYLDPGVVDQPDPEPAMVDKLGEAETSYLATVAWWGPAAGDVHRAAQMRRQLWAEPDETTVRFGYDVFGRLVAHDQRRSHLVVEQPQRLPAQPYPDDAELLGTPLAQVVFVRLPDGRCDILPADPRNSPDGFTWGYGGSGPRRLIEAISFAVLPHPDPDHPLETRERPRPVRKLLEDLVINEPDKDQPLRLTVAQLREVPDPVEAADLDGDDD